MARCEGSLLPHRSRRRRDRWWSLQLEATVAATEVEGTVAMQHPPLCSGATCIAVKRSGPTQPQPQPQPHTRSHTHTVTHTHSHTHTQPHTHAHAWVQCEAAATKAGLHAPHVGIDVTLRVGLRLLRALCIRPFVSTVGTTAEAAAPAVAAVPLLVSPFLELAACTPLSPLAVF